MMPSLALFDRVDATELMKNPALEGEGRREKGEAANCAKTTQSSLMPSPFCLDVARS
jgi:hypothetical protein